MGHAPREERNWRETPPRKTNPRTPTAMVKLGRKDEEFRDGEEEEEGEVS